MAPLIYLISAPGEGFLMKSNLPLIQEVGIHYVRAKWASIYEDLNKYVLLADYGVRVLKSYRGSMTDIKKINQ